jgi:predicted transcriptional regulator
MRTTVRLDDHLLREAKALAVKTGRTLTAVIEDALRATIASHRRERRPPRVALPTFKGKGLQAGVDLDDTAGVLEIMDGRRDSS